MRKHLSRQSALSQGVKRYFTGKSCVNGHISERYAAGRGCVTCIKIRLYADLAANPSLRKHYSQTRHIKNLLSERANRMLTSAKLRAKKQNQVFDLTKNDILMNGKFPSNCPCCSKSFRFAYKEKKRLLNSTPSLDRLNPEEGYTKTNTKIICCRCNRIKNDGSEHEHRQIADWIRRESVQLIVHVDA
jgi:hypothetical protein